MPQCVRRDVEGDGGLAEVFLKNRIDRAGRESLAQLGDEERAFVNLGGASVNLHRFHGVGADRDESLLGSFAHDADTFVDGVDVWDVERGELGETESGGVEEFQDGGVTFAHPGGSLAFELGLHGKREEFFDLGEGENNRKGFVGLGKLDFGNGAFWIATAVDEEFVKGAVGREAEADGASCEFGFLELEEIGAEVIGREIPPLGEALTEPFPEEAKGEGVVLESLRRRVLLGRHELDETINLGVR